VKTFLASETSNKGNRSERSGASLPICNSLPHEIIISLRAARRVSHSLGGNRRSLRHASLTMNASYRRKYIILIVFPICCERRAGKQEQVGLCYRYSQGP